MMKKINVTISDKAHKVLRTFKLKNDVTTLDEAIDNLLLNYKQIKKW